jgi:hypothetical protein
MGTRQSEQRVRGDFAQVHQKLRKLNGGGRRIRTPETLSPSMEGILPSLEHYAASKKSLRAEENLSTWIRFFFAISVVSLVRYARAGSWVMSNVRRTFRVRIPTSKTGRQDFTLPFHCAHGLTFSASLRAVYMRAGKEPDAVTHTDCFRCT